MVSSGKGVMQTEWDFGLTSNCLVTSNWVPTCMQTGKWLEMAAIRHETTLSCGIGAVARYFCHRFTVMNSPPPNPHEDSKGWWVLFF